MSTQTRNTGGGGRNQKKSNSGSGGGSGSDSTALASVKKTDATKTEKEKIHPKPTAEQLRIAQITNSNATEDPQMREKVATLTEMTQRSEEEICCALHECDYNLERSVVFLLETLPVGAFETSSKKKKNKAASAGQEGGAGDGDWATDANANTDKREKSRNRSSNRGGRGGTDSRGWRGREARENDRNVRESRGGDRGGDRGGEERNDNYRSGQRGSGRSGGGGRGGGYVGRGGRGGGRMGGGRGSSGRSGGSGGYAARQNINDDQHQEVELWDNTIAQNAEKQQNQTQDDAWGDWDNEEYMGSLKDSKVFTTSNLPNQTAASVVSGGVCVGVTTELSAPPGLEQHLGTSVLGGASTGLMSGTINAVGSLVDDNNPSAASVAPAAAPMMQYSAAVASTQMPQQQQPQQPPQQQQQQQPQQQLSPVSGVATATGSLTAAATQFSGTADAFSNAATAAANLVQQVQQVQQQQQQPQIKSSATLSAEQSQYFNSLSTQNAAASVANVQQQMVTYAQQTSAPVQFPTSYANVFGTGATTAAAAANVNAATGSVDAIHLPTGPQPRRARAKLPPPSKIPSSAVEMPGDSLNNIGYLDVQFGALDFGPDDSFDTIPEKFNNATTIDGQQPQQQQDVANDYQNKTNVQQQQQQQQSALAAGLQNSQISESLSNAYTQRGGTQQSQQQVGVGGGSTTGGGSALDQLTKSDPYNQTAATNVAGYQSSYQVNAAANKSGYQQAGTTGATYNSSNYANVQSSVANTYQQQTYGSYQQNSVNSYQQQQQQQATAGSAQSGVANSAATGSNVSGGVSGGSGSSTQNIPVGGGVSGGSSTTTGSSANSGYLSSGYPTQQSAYQSTQSVYGSSALSNNAGFAGSTNTSTSQYSNFSTSAKLKDTPTASSTSHFESVSSTNVAASSSGTVVSSVTSVVANSASAPNLNSSANVNNANSIVSNATSNSSSTNAATNSTSNAVSASAGVGSGNGSGSSSGGGVGGVVGVGGGSGVSGVSGGGGTGSNASSVVASSAASVASSSNKNSAGGGGMVPNIQMVSQYIQTGLPYYQQPVYSYEDLQMMQQRVPHVQGYYDLNYTPTSLGAGRDNLAYSTMTDGRFTRTDNNSSPVSNVSSTMSQQAGSGGPMLNVPYYFYSGNVMPGSFQYGTPAIYPPQIPTANTASGGQFAKPSYNAGYGSNNYDTLSQSSQDYNKGAYPSSGNQQTKSQNVTNPPQAGTGSEMTSSMYGKTHVALNKVNSYEKQNFHSGTPPPFNMPNTQTAGGTSAQPYGMYLPMPAAGHHNMIHPPLHQMDGRIHSSSRRDSNSTGQRQQTSSQSKSGSKQGYSPSYWAGQN